MNNLVILTKLEIVGSLKWLRFSQETSFDVDTSRIAYPVAIIGNATGRSILVITWDNVYTVRCASCPYTKYAYMR